MKQKTSVFAFIVGVSVAFLALAGGGCSRSSPIQKRSTAGMTDAPAALASNLIFFKFENIIPEEPMPMQTLVIDETSVYCWANPEKGKWQILKVNKEGGEPLPVVASDAYVSAFAVDDKDIYWVATDMSAMKSRIMKVSKQGGSSTELVSLQGATEQILIDRDNLYYFFYPPGGIRGDGSLVKINKQGGSPATLAENLFGIFGIGLDDKRIYWTTSTEDTLNWVDKGGGERQAIPVEDAGQIFIDEKSIYVASVKRGLLQLDKNGTEVAVLWPSVSSLWCRMTADEESIYFNAPVRTGVSDNGDATFYLFKLSKKDGNVTAVLKDQAFFELAIDGGRLYWIDYRNKILMKAGKAKLPDSDPSAANGLLPLLSVAADEQLYFGGNKISITEVTEKLKALMKAKLPPEKTIYLKGAEAVKYGTYVAVLTAARDAGASRVNFMVSRENGYPLGGMQVVEILNPFAKSLTPPKELSASGNEGQRGKPEADIDLPSDLLVANLKSGVEETVELNSKPMSIEEMQNILKDLFEMRLDKMIVLKASKSRSYGDVVKVLRAFEQAGAERIIMQLEYLEQ